MNLMLQVRYNRPPPPSGFENSKVGTTTHQLVPAYNTPGLVLCSQWTVLPPQLQDRYNRSPTRNMKVAQISEGPQVAQTVPIGT
jgi:hypothetical protein